MIITFLILSFFILVGSIFRKHAFEVTIAVLLAVPIEAFLLGKFVGQSSVLTFCLIAINFLAAYLVIPHQRFSLKESIKYIIPGIVWILASIVVYIFCIQWPDFISMGERLRDYALLAEVVKYPSYPNEPWMDGSQLNYYLYWYRFGAFLHQITGAPVWELYHVLQSFTFGLYIALIYRLITKLCVIQFYYAIIISFIIAFGSNVAGLLYVIEPAGQTWWGPSRVVLGAINEFPAWSFLLGDLHPHYLNLPLFLFLFCLLQSFSAQIHNQNRFNLTAIASVFILTAIGALWLYNSNAWEVPVWGILIGFCLLLIFNNYKSTFIFQGLFDEIKTIPNHVGKLLTNGSFIIISILIVLITASLLLSAMSISSGGDPFRLISSKIALTTTKEFFTHWGYFLALLIPSFIIRAKDNQQRFVFALGFIACLLSSIALPLIILMLVIQGLHAFNVHDQEENKQNQFFINVLGLTTLTLLFLPEIVFLDDPYGGENERMNTIFKAYSLNWGLLGVFTAIVAWKELPKLCPDQELVGFLKPLCLGIVLAVSVPFFISTVSERISHDRSVTPTNQGLSILNTQHPGAAFAIQQLSLLPDGITLESQGNPYSLTTHVATLGGKRSYLGWINHVDLLTRNYAETKRRSEVTERIYSSPTCGEAAIFIKNENIRYIVFGPLEKERFQGRLLNDFSCFNSIINQGNYQVFTLQ